MMDYIILQALPPCPFFSCKIRHWQSRFWSHLAARSDQLSQRSQPAHKLNAHNSSCEHTSRPMLLFVFALSPHVAPLLVSSLSSFRCLVLTASPQPSLHHRLLAPLARRLVLVWSGLGLLALWLAAPSSRWLAGWLRGDGVGLLLKLACWRAGPLFVALALAFGLGIGHPVRSKREEYYSQRGFVSPTDQPAVQLRVSSIANGRCSSYLTPFAFLVRLSSLVGMS